MGGEVSPYVSLIHIFFLSILPTNPPLFHLPEEIIFRKSDVRKKGLTRGWELMLSHSFRTGMTTGYAKGTESSDLVESIKHLKHCTEQVMHPLLLPVIVLSHDQSYRTDQKQRDARDWLRRLEHAVSMRDEIAEDESYVKKDVLDLEQINRDLVECHSQVLWKRPQAYMEIIDSMESALERFWDVAQIDPKYGGRRGVVGRLHRNMLARLEFYHGKLKGIENYAHTTLERLTIQRSAVSGGETFVLASSSFSLSSFSPSPSLLNPSFSLSLTSSKAPITRLEP